MHTVKNAVDCTKLGAITYLQKPFTTDKIKTILDELITLTQKSIKESKYNDFFEYEYPLLLNLTLTIPITRYQKQKTEIICYRLKKNVHLESYYISFNFSIKVFIKTLLMLNIFFNIYIQSQ